jgi:uncharacterized membrane protein
VYEGDTEPIPRVRAKHRYAPEVEDDEPVLVHGHGHAEPASGRVRGLLAALLIPFALAAAVGAGLLFHKGGTVSTRAAGEPVHGVVTAVQSGSCNGQTPVNTAQDSQCRTVRVRMTDGRATNREIGVVVPLEPSTPRFTVDDKVVLAYAGGDPADAQSYQLVDFQRSTPLLLLAALFALAVLVLGRWQGIKALVALGMSFGVLVLFVLPAIIAGENPLLVAVIGAGVIMFVVLYLTHGLSARTSTAVLGTLISLAAIGGLGALFSVAGKLTGLDEDTATLVGALGHGIDTRGLLLAGVVIGALGVLDDVTVTQTSAVWELRRVNASLSAAELFASAMRIGRDHISSAVNTLVLAYAGAALPLMLFFTVSGKSLGQSISAQDVASEVVRTLAGSIGLVASVPITTAVAALVASRERGGS